MTDEESKIAWELTGEWQSSPPWKRDPKAATAGAWPKGVLEDLAGDKSIVARDEKRMLFTQKQSAEVWRERLTKEDLAAADRWDLKQVRIAKKDSALAKAMDEAGITPSICEEYYVLNSDFFERGLALELVMALRKRIESLEQSE